MIGDDIKVALNIYGRTRALNLVWAVEFACFHSIGAQLPAAGKLAANVHSKSLTTVTALHNCVTKVFYIGKKIHFTHTHKIIVISHRLDMELCYQTKGSWHFQKTSFSNSYRA